MKDNKNAQAQPAQQPAASAETPKKRTYKKRKTAHSKARRPETAAAIPGTPGKTGGAGKGIDPGQVASQWSEKPELLATWHAKETSLVHARIKTLNGIGRFLTSVGTPITDFALEGTDVQQHQQNRRAMGATA